MRSIGDLLRDAGEVAAVNAVLDALLPLLDELGAKPDTAYLNHHRWPAVAAVARGAYRLLTGADNGRLA